MYAAGYESASDDDDDDGFVLGDEFENKRKTIVRETNASPAVSTVKPQKLTPKGGFGVPANYKGYRTNDQEAGLTNTSPYTLDQFKDVVVRGSLDQVKEMVQAGMPVDAELRCGWTTLMYAANMAFPEKLAYLIDAGADVNYDKDQYTVLMTACSCNKDRPDDIYACVDELLKRGAKVNTFDRYHSSSLMNASREGHERVVTRLIDEGADINKQNNRGWTALSWAVSKGHVEVVTILMKAGANEKIVHTDGQRAVDVAQYLGYDEIALLLGESQPATNGSVLSTVSLDASGDSPDKSFQTYGELELFLSGLNLNDLIPEFRKHKITFDMLLQMNDKDLLDMNISELGNRKRILDGIHAVHKKDWETSSLPAVHYNKTLTYEDTLAMIANISKHLKYIASSVTYMNAHISEQPALLEESAVIRAGHFKSPDNISSSSSRRSWAIPRYTCLKYAAVAAAVGCGVYWRRPIFSALTGFTGRLQRWMSVDL